MKRAAAIFAAITAVLEDMHAIAVGGQAPDLSPDERLMFLSELRAGLAQLEQQVGDVNGVLNR